MQGLFSSSCLQEIFQAAMLWLLHNCCSFQVATFDHAPENCLNFIKTDLQIKGKMQSLEFSLMEFPLIQLYEGYTNNF